MSEVDEIRKRYEARKGSTDVASAMAASTYNKYIADEREQVYAMFLRSHFSDMSRLRLLEIGAGSGSNLPCFHDMGIPWSGLYANELLEERVAMLKNNFPEVSVYPGDALALPFQETFDVVFQSTVFTSILDADFKRKLAQKMWQMTRPGGMVLWYDFVYDNPRNPDVKGVPVGEVRSLFHQAASFTVQRVTLAPPVGRKVGKLYSIFNFFPFLRTHTVIAIAKPQ
jgi:SAM-dependent methyltransferase